MGRAASEEGLCLGLSSGINVAGAVALGRKLGRGARIATILCDTGFRYLSTIYNAAWLEEKGLPVSNRDEAVMALISDETTALRGDKNAGAATEPLLFHVSSERELRSQSVHRLQLGLFGLCAVLLIIGLANIIMDRAQTIDADDPNAQVIAADADQAEPVVDPLADAGVVPAADPTPGAGPAGRCAFPGKVIAKFLPLLAGALALAPAAAAKRGRPCIGTAAQPSLSLQPAAGHARSRRHCRPARRPVPAALGAGRAARTRRTQTDRQPCGRGRQAAAGRQLAAGHGPTMAARRPERENVALDDWVRAGGARALFADPLLTFNSRFSIGDRRRPQDVATLSPILTRSARLERDEDAAPDPFLADIGGARSRSCCLAVPP